MKKKRGFHRDLYLHLRKTKHKFILAGRISFVKRSLE